MKDYRHCSSMLFSIITSVGFIKKNSNVRRLTKLVTIMNKAILNKILDLRKSTNDYSKSIHVEITVSWSS